MSLLSIFLFVAAIFGGLLIFGLLYDVIAKKKNKRFDPNDGIKNAKDSQRLYTEQYLHESRSKTGTDDL